MNLRSPSNTPISDRVRKETSLDRLLRKKYPYLSLKRGVKYHMQCRDSADKKVEELGDIYTHTYNSTIGMYQIHLQIEQEEVDEHIDNQIKEQQEREERKVQKSLF